MRHDDDALWRSNTTLLVLHLETNKYFATYTVCKYTNRIAAKASMLDVEKRLQIFVCRWQCTPRPVRRKNWVSPSKLHFSHWRFTMICSKYHFLYRRWTLSPFLIYTQVQLLEKLLHQMSLAVVPVNLDAHGMRPALFGRMRLISWRHVLFWFVWYGLHSSRTGFYIDRSGPRSSRSESEKWVWSVNIETGSTRMQTVPNASEKDVTSRNKTLALKKRMGRMPCAYSFSHMNHQSVTHHKWKRAENSTYSIYSIAIKW